MSTKRVLMIKVVPGAKESKIVSRDGDLLKIRIHAPADKGKANEALIAFLAKEFLVSKSSITILSGATSRLKRVEIS